MPNDEHSHLVEAAKEASSKAYAPYSGLRVGAAVTTEDGEVFTGCNVENASYGLTMCAERVALFSALAKGAKDITAVAVYADSPTPTPPCGACRQVIHELAPDSVVVIGRPDGEHITKSARSLLPFAFDYGNLAENERETASKAGQE